MLVLYLLSPLNVGDVLQIGVHMYFYILYSTLNTEAKCPFLLYMKMSICLNGTTGCCGQGPSCYPGLCVLSRHLVGFLGWGLMPRRAFTYTRQHKCRNNVYVCTYMHTYMHACIHTCMHTYIHTYMHTCMHTYMHTCMHAYIYIHTCMHAY